jgi:hypothetical protein
MEIATAEIASLRKVCRINWRTVSKSVQIHLLETLASNAKIPHLRFLSSHDLTEIQIGDLGRTLNGMYQSYTLSVPKTDGDSIVDYMLDQLGVERMSLERPPLEVKLAYLRSRKEVPWKKLDRETILYLLEEQRKACGCFHIRAMHTPELEGTKLGCLGHSFRGLVNHYWKMARKEGKSFNYDYMFDKLGAAKLEDEDIGLVLQGLKESRRIYWERIPNRIIIHLLNLLKEAAGVKHLRFLTTDHFRNIALEAIGRSLFGLLASYRIRQPSYLKIRHPLDYMLDCLGVESFAAIPLADQLEYIRNQDRVFWDRIPKVTIGFLIHELARKAHLPHVRFLNSSHFFLIKLKSISATLAGLYFYYARKLKSNDRGHVIEQSLDDLGVIKVGALPVDRQVKLLKIMLHRSEARHVARIPLPEQAKYFGKLSDPAKIYLLTRLKIQVGAASYRHLNWRHFRKVALAELDHSLDFVRQYYMAEWEQSPSGNIMDFICDKLRLK